jgi:hypothetical protein
LLSWLKGAAEPLLEFFHSRIARQLPALTCTAGHRPVAAVEPVHEAAPTELLPVGLAPESALAVFASDVDAGKGRVGGETSQPCAVVELRFRGPLSFRR